MQMNTLKLLSFIVLLLTTTLFLEACANNNMSAVVNSDNIDAANSTASSGHDTLTTDGMPSATDIATLSTPSPTVSSGEGTEIANVENYLIQNVSELSKLGDYIAKKSKGDACLNIQVSPNLVAVYKDNDKSQSLGDFYLVNVGEQWSDHQVNWNWFYIKDDLSEILWYDMTNDQVLSLAEWRKSQSYTQELNGISSAAPTV